MATKPISSSSSDPAADTPTTTTTDPGPDPDPVAPILGPGGEAYGDAHTTPDIPTDIADLGPTTISPPGAEPPDDPAADTLPS